MFEAHIQTATHFLELHPSTSQINSIAVTRRQHKTQNTQPNSRASFPGPRNLTNHPSSTSVSRTRSAGLQPPRVQSSPVQSHVTNQSHIHDRHQPQQHPESRPGKHIKLPIVPTIETLNPPLNHSQHNNKSSTASPPPNTREQFNPT